RRAAEWRGGDVDGMEMRLRALGFDARRDGDRVITEDDDQVEPTQALKAMRDALGDAVVEGRVTGVEQVGRGWRATISDREIEASGMVLATGVADAVPGLPPATTDLIRAIQPIRG